MSQSIITTLLNSWLVVAFILFLVILWRTFRPAARAQMERNGRIPFEGKETNHERN